MNIPALVAALEPLAPGRVFPEVVPQDVLTSTNRAPFIRYSIVALTTDNTIDGISESHSDETRIQIDAYTTTFSAGETMQESLRDVLQAFNDPPATIELIVSFYEDDAKMFRRTVDAVFHSSTTV